jgi:hypothetical protein
VTLRSVLICGLAASSLGGCYGLYGHDEMELYARRADVVTMSAGDAKEVNARTHMLTPWPGYVGDRRIPMDGTRAVRAVECYRTATSSQGGAAAGFGPQVAVTVNNAPGTASSAGPGAPKC